MDKYTARNTDGSVNLTASVAAYTKALTDWITINEIDNDRIEAAVEKVFDRNNGRLPMPMLLSFAAAEVSNDPSQFKTLQKRIHAYVNGQKAIGRIKVIQGQGGGVVRVVKPGEEIPVAKSA